MKRVGLRELKNRLSHYVREVQAGREIQVTDRGEAVAELLPPRRVTGELGIREWLGERARRGLITLGAPHDPRRYCRLSRLAPSGTAQRLVDEERGDR